MQIVILILLVLAGLIALLLLIALFIRREHYVRRGIVINAPVQKVFDYVKLLQNQETFSKWAATDPGRKKEFRGTDGTAGYVYAWSGDKNAGVGEKEIKRVVEGKRIESEIRFVKPMAAVAEMIMETEELPGNRTQVFWSNRSKLNYPLNIMVPMIEKMIRKEMDISLANLKNILEK